MRTALCYAALSCALGLVNAKVLWWGDDSPRWIPARETPVFQPMLGNNIQAPAPAPTPAPILEPRDGLHARNLSENTCAYVSGIQASSLWCAATARCVYNSVNSHIGCCDDTATLCPVWTTCYDSSERASFTTDNGFTMWCGNGSYPHCLTYIYYDPVFTGYTLLGCGVAAATEKVWYTPLTSSSSSSTSTTSSSTSSFSSTSTSSSSSSSTSTSTSQTATATPAPDSGSSTPIGAIVGGVVGGLAAIGLIILGIWFLMRQNNKQKREATAAAGGAPGAPGAAPYQQPPPPTTGPQDPSMAQKTYYAGAAPPATGFNPLDPRASVAKPGGVAYSTTGSTAYDGQTSVPHSPAPAYQQGTPSPPPQQQMGAPFGGYPQQQPHQGYEQQQPQQGWEHQHQQQQQQQFGNVPPGAQQQQPGVGYQQQAQVPPQQQHQYSAELPTQRGDGELTELQG